MLEDSVLLWRLRRGDAEALRVLYDKYKGSLRTMAASMLGSRGDGEDVLQDVFVSFAENVGNIRIRTSLMETGIDIWTGTRQRCSGHRR